MEKRRRRRSELYLEGPVRGDLLFGYLWIKYSWRHVPFILWNTGTKTTAVKIAAAILM